MVLEWDTSEANKLLQTKGNKAMIFESKIREMFKNFRDTPELENIRDRKFAVWALATDIPWGGPYYLLGSPTHMELWISKDQTSRVSKGKKVVRVKNDAEGFAKLCEDLEKHIERMFPEYI